jgi:hypothetical protein
MPLNHFDYLSGCIGVNADAPKDWEPLRSIITGQLFSPDLPFWSDPNNDAWGVQLCRILYHESVHFWLLLSSAYIASLVADEWDRLLRYEETGVLSPPTNTVRDHAITLPDNPFSASELVECWARYWDVHTRGPDKILREEGITGDDAALRGQYGYTGAAYDLVMQSGEDCGVYGRPYRWLLERWGSRRTALIFPIITHAALSTCRPVTMFCCFASPLPPHFGNEAEAQKRKKIDQFIEESTGVVNLDWLRGYGLIVDALIRPWLEVFCDPIIEWLRCYGIKMPGSLLRPLSKEMEMPILADGLSIIQTSSLKSHPIFTEYANRLLPIWVKGYLEGIPAALPPNTPYLEEYKKVLTGFAGTSPVIMLALPGQPAYRFLLGHLVPPPKIAFRNITWYAMRSAIVRLEELHLRESGGDKKTDETYEERVEIIERKVWRFRAAEKAVSLGLPPNAFET